MRHEQNWQQIFPLFCERCERYMKLVRCVPKLGELPPLETYRCIGCDTVQTVERQLH